MRDEPLSVVLLDEAFLTVGQMASACAVHIDWVIGHVDDGVLTVTATAGTEWLFSARDLQRARPHPPSGARVRRRTRTRGAGGGSAGRGRHAAGEVAGGGAGVDGANVVRIRHAEYSNPYRACVAAEGSMPSTTDNVCRRRRYVLNASARRPVCA